MTNSKTYTYLLTDGEIYKQYIDIHIENEQVIGFLPYIIYFDPMGKRRRPKRKDPFLVTQEQLDQAREWAKMKAGIWSLEAEERPWTK